MASEVYPDPPPPSYAEATGASWSANTSRSAQADESRRYTSTASAISGSNSHSYSRGRFGGSACSSGEPMFPQVFSLYCQSPRHYFIGVNQNTPLYAVSTYSTLSMRPDVVLHNGASQDAHEVLGSVGAFTRIMSFSIETTASGRSREYFEWRHSSGIEVEALGGRHSGTSYPSPFSNPLRRHRISGGTSNSMLLGHSSDGKEVVAVCAGASLSVSKVLRFRFLGTGADGSLGSRWAIMAVASALAIWNRDRRSRSGGLTYASAGF
ncbi:hypothetical protein F5Y07DRAFT_400132 [Xylaria sp. FL0933]|nr:hypothetical protein F5Y07DRAFT_400132 [Xylaria sp. FL0933]